MSKQEKKVNQDSMEEFLASVPDQVTESDDFQLAQKGLSYLQESTDYAQGTALVKGRKGLLWIALMAFIILVGVASILILALWPGSSQNMIYYDESLIYPEDNFGSIADYNAAYHTNFLNMDAAENGAVVYVAHLFFGSIGSFGNGYDFQHQHGHGKEGFESLNFMRELTVKCSSQFLYVLSADDAGVRRRPL